MTAAKAATMEGIALPEITSHTLQSFPAKPGLKLQSCSIIRLQLAHTFVSFDIHAKVEDSLLVKLRKDVEVSQCRLLLKC